MIAVNVAELRNDTEKYLDAVARGETVEVCRDGKAIAIVSPVTRRGADFLRRIKPLEARGLSLSEELLADRDRSR